MKIGELVTSRRNFIIRALGFTAAGATCAVPIVTLADAQARVDYHLKGLEAAFRDLYPGAEVRVRANKVPPELLYDREQPAVALAMIMADRFAELRLYEAQPLAARRRR